MAQRLRATRTVAPLGGSAPGNAVGRTRLALHLHPGRHAHVAPERLEPPRTVLARRAEEVAARRLPPVLLNHSRRTSASVCHWVS